VTIKVRIKQHPPCELCGSTKANLLHTEKGITLCRDATQCDMRIAASKVNISSTWIF
jgi:hypothetical protein